MITQAFKSFHELMIYLIIRFDKSHKSCEFPWIALRRKNLM